MSTRDDETRRLLKRWRFAQHVIDESGRIVENPRLGEEAREILWELQQVWERGDGNPPDVRARFRNELARALCAHLLYIGAFPLGDAPSGLRLPWVKQRGRLYLEYGLQECKGKRSRSNQAAAKILNTSETQVREAVENKINTDGTWELASVAGHTRALTAPELLDLWSKVRPSRG